MSDLLFEWDPRKASSNVSKHGVGFDEARTVFYDEYALVIPDPDHSQLEERFVLMGMSHESKMLVVVHCFRGEEGKIRIISARRAGSKEQRPYWERQE